MKWNERLLTFLDIWIYLNISSSVNIQAATGVKRARTESWERSVGVLGSGKALGTLVLRKKPSATISKPGPVVNTSTDTAATSTSQKGNLLSFCSNYFMQCKFYTSYYFKIDP